MESEDSRQLAVGGGAPPFGGINYATSRPGRDQRTADESQKLETLNFELLIIFPGILVSIGIITIFAVLLK